MVGFRDIILLTSLEVRVKGDKLNLCGMAMGRSHHWDSLAGDGSLSSGYQLDSRPVTEFLSSNPPKLDFSFKQMRIWESVK